MKEKFIIFMICIYTIASDEGLSCQLKSIHFKCYHLQCVLDFEYANAFCCEVSKKLDIFYRYIGTLLVQQMELQTFSLKVDLLLLVTGLRDGVIVINVLPDNIPELTEKYTVNLTSVDGGAEIEKTKRESLFSIRLVNRQLCKMCNVCHHKRFTVAGKVLNFL